MERTPARSFEDLLVWQKTHQAVLMVYRASARFPRPEIFGLTAQFRRAAVSIAANIAEGFKKRTKPDKAKFLNIAQGSVEECRYYVILARDLAYMPDEGLLAKFDEVARMLGAYIHRLRGPDSPEET